jgi:hypothetical protein
MLASLLRPGHLGLGLCVHSLVKPPPHQADGIAERLEQLGRAAEQQRLARNQEESTGLQALCAAADSVTTLHEELVQVCVSSSVDGPQRCRELLVHSGYHPRRSCRSVATGGAAGVMKCEQRKRRCPGLDAGLPGPNRQGPGRARAAPGVGGACGLPD